MNPSELQPLETDGLTHMPGALTTLEADTLLPILPDTETSGAQKKPSLIGLDMGELKAVFASIGMETYRAKQVWNWLYARGAKDFSEMSNISKKTQALLEEHFTIARPTITRHLVSNDGTQKWLLGMADQQKIESVFIPERTRGSLCVSSQVGCTLSCSFCHTGTMPLVRNLTAGEIVAQVMICRDGLNEWGKPNAPKSKLTPPIYGGAGGEAISNSKAFPPAPPVNGGDDLAYDGRMFTNIVMMGMGEPLYNYDQVAKALKIIMDTDGIGMSKRRITLSTSGVVPMIEKCGQELGVNLAISLHAVNDDLRNVLVPLNKKYPLSELMEACRNYPGSSNARRITFEYVMLKGVNDSDAEARQLVQMLKGIHAKVNLIPFNPWHGSQYETSTDERVEAFSDIVNRGGYSAPIRRPRGRDIYAACGMLKSDSERKKGQKIWLGDKKPQ